MNVLAIDQGTSSTKALVVAPDGSLLSAVEIPVHPRPTDGGVVQDPAELLGSVIEAGRQALASSDEPVEAIGLANQGETVLAWDPSTGMVDGVAISWQDGRAASVCEAMADEAGWLTELTGLPLDPYFSAPKLSWLRSRSTAASVTTTDTWLLHRLTGAYVTDVTTASRSMLLDLDRRRWSPEALAAFGLSDLAMPEVVGCAERIGTTDAFGPSLPVTGLAVDQQAALIGQSCLVAGEAKCTYGTGAFLLMSCGNAPVRSRSGLSASVAFDAGGQVGYCLDGQAYTAGAAVTWLIEMGLLRSAEDLDAVASEVQDAGGVRAVPALAGLGAPWWRPEVRGTLEGLDLGTRPGHVVRAVIEGLCAQVALLCRAAAGEVGVGIPRLRVDGGLTRSQVLLQTQADLLQVPVEVSSSPHATALGVAALARVGLEGGRLEPTVPASARIVEPAISADEAEHRLASFSASVDRAVEASR